MRVARVLTNETCNQNCPFCTTRRPTERADFVRREAVLRRIAGALTEGAREIVFAGGEPTLRRDLEQLIAAAREGGAQGAVLETNAALITRERAESLRAAGLERVRAKLPAWGEAADAITRDEGGFEATRGALRALREVGLATELVVPVVRANLTVLRDLPARLEEDGLAPEVLWISVLHDAPDPEELASVSEAAGEVDGMVPVARRHGIALRLDPRGWLPPCVFPEPGRVAHLYTLSRGDTRRSGFSRVAECDSCRARDRCPGFPNRKRAPEAELAVRPIREDRLRRRLSVISSLVEQSERELVTREVCRRADGSTAPMFTVRVNFHCNQSCHFCFVSTHLPPASEDRVRRAIAEAGAARAILALSGGEPTLNPRLEDYARLGKDSGVIEIELQTNAIRLAEPGRVERLRDAGVDVVFVSLHGPNAEISDAVTNAPGTFEQTVVGLDRVVAAGMRMRMNFVFCELNRQSFPDFVRMAGARWPGALVSISFVASSTDLVPRERWLVPRYSDVMPFMAEGMGVAREVGVGITGLESMCGVPLCLVPEGLEKYFGLAEIGAGADAGEFIKTAACQDCSLAERCWGLRRGYAELYGESELRPVHG